MYSTRNGGKSVVAERFIRTVKDKMCKHMTAVSKMCILITWMDIINQYNNIYQRTIKLSLLKLKIMHIVTTLKKLMIKILNLKLVIMLEHQNTKNIFARGYTPKWSEEVFLIKEVKNTVPWTVIMMKKMMMKKLLENYMKKNYKK